MAKNKEGKPIPGKKIVLSTNQFRVQFNQDLSVFVYPIEIIPEPTETFLQYEIMGTLNKQLKTIFYPFLI